MGQDDVDMDGDKVAAGEDGDSLYEGIQGVKGESCEGGDCFCGVMDDVYLFVPDGVVKQSMTPVGEELVVAEVEQKVEWGQGCERPSVLYFGEVWVSHFDEGDEGHLS